MIEERLAEGFLLVFLFPHGALVGFAERLLPFGEGVCFRGEGFGLAALFLEHFREGGGVVFEHFPELLLDAILLVAELLGLALLLLGKLLLRRLVGGVAGHFLRLLSCFFGPVLCFHRELLLAVGEFVEFGNGLVILLGLAHRLREFVEIADGFLDLFTGFFGVGDPLLFRVGDGDHVGFFLGLGEGLVGDLFRLLGLLPEKRGVEGGGDLLEFFTRGFVMPGELTELFFRLFVDLFRAVQLLLGAAHFVAGAFEFLLRFADLLVDLLALGLDRLIGDGLGILIEGHKDDFAQSDPRPVVVGRPIVAHADLHGEALLLRGELQGRHVEEGAGVVGSRAGGGRRRGLHHLDGCDRPIGCHEEGDIAEAEVFDHGEGDGEPLGRLQSYVALGRLGNLHGGGFVRKHVDGVIRRFVFKALFVGDLEMPVAAHPGLELEIPRHAIFHGDRIGDFGGLVEHHLRGPRRLVEGGGDGDAGVGDGADLARPAIGRGVRQAGVIGIVVGHGEVLNRGGIDSDDVVILTQRGPSADAVVEALFHGGEGQGKTFRAISLFGDQSHALDGFGAVGEEPTNLGPVETFVFYRDLDRDRFSACDTDIAGLDHEGVGVGIADVEKGRESPREESP